MQVQSKEKKFEGQTIYVGIDVHKKNWKVSMYCNDIEHKQMTIDPSSAILANYLKSSFPGANYEAVYEAGFSGFTACRELSSLGINCKVVHAADVPSTQKEKLQKTDTIDSRKLAKSLMHKTGNFVHIPDVKLESDRALLRQRAKLSNEIAKVKLRVKSLLFQFGIAIPDYFTIHQVRYWSSPFTKWLEELVLPEKSLRDTLDRHIKIGQFLRSELLLANRQVRELSRTEFYKESYELISSIPGIGSISGMHLLVQLGDISRFRTLDELNYYIGLVPSMYGSGERMVTGKLIKRGHKPLKIHIIEASWIAVRNDPAMMLTFIELSKRMAKNKAIIRIARKIVSRIRHVLIHKERYKTSVN